MADRIQFRRDTAANWTAYNPILLEGELGFELDTDQYKLGDGIHTWSALPYRGAPCVQQMGSSTTTPMSQKAVTDIFNSLRNSGYLYAGLATSSTNPGTPTEKVFYVALEAGTYTNFWNLVVTQGINFLKYNGTAWSQEQLIGIDDVPTLDSNNLVKSGGVYASIAEINKSVQPYMYVDRECYLSLVGDGVQIVPSPANHTYVSVSGYNALYISCLKNCSYNIQANSTNDAYIWFLKSKPSAAGQTYDPATGYENSGVSIPKGKSLTIISPDDAVYLCVGTLMGSSGTRKPESITYFAQSVYWSLLIPILY